MQQSGQRGQLSVKSCDRAMGRSQAFLATLTTAEVATRARAGVDTSASIVPAVARAWVRMTERNRAAGHSATGVSVRVSDGRAALRKLCVSHKSRDDATPADHGSGAASDDSGTDGRLAVELVRAARTTSAPWDNAG